MLGDGSDVFDWSAGVEERVPVHHSSNVAVLREGVTTKMVTTAADVVESLVFLFADHQHGVQWFWVVGHDRAETDSPEMSERQTQTRTKVLSEVTIIPSMFTLIEIPMNRDRLVNEVRVGLHYSMSPNDLSKHHGNIGPVILNSQTISAPDREGNGIDVEEHEAYRDPWEKDGYSEQIHVVPETYFC